MAGQSDDLRQTISTCIITLKNIEIRERDIIMKRFVDLGSKETAGDKRLKDVIKEGKYVK